LQGHLKLSLIGIFGLKIFHLATLLLFPLKAGKGQGRSAAGMQGSPDGR
jgi:hypothetical protein